MIWWESKELDKLRERFKLLKFDDISKIVFLVLFNFMNMFGVSI